MALALAGGRCIRPGAAIKSSVARAAASAHFGAAADARRAFSFFARRAADLAAPRGRLGRGATPPLTGRLGLAALFGAMAARGGPGCSLAPASPPPGMEYATLAGGCFWGTELALQRVPGVITTRVGYTQGQMPSPTYEDVCSGRTGHTEAVQVVYDPSAVTFNAILKAFGDKTDLTTLNRQGNDAGTQYRSGVYYHTADQKDAAAAFFAELEKAGGRKIVAELLPAGDFYVAENYHQQYLEKGGRGGQGQSAAKGCTDRIRCYG